MESKFCFLCLSDIVCFCSKAELNYFFALLTQRCFIFYCSYIYANTNDDHQDVYRARIWSKNSILITSSAWEYSLLYNRDMYEAGLKVTNAPAGIIDAVDDALHTYNDNLNGNQQSGCDV